MQAEQSTYLSCCATSIEPHYIPVLNRGFSNVAVIHAQDVIEEAPLKWLFPCIFASLSFASGRYTQPDGRSLILDNGGWRGVDANTKLPDGGHRGDGRGIMLIFFIPRHRLDAASPAIGRPVSSFILTDFHVIFIPFSVRVLIIFIPYRGWIAEHSRRVFVVITCIRVF